MEKRREKEKRRTNTLYTHVYVKATTSATDVREDKVIGSFLLRLASVRACVPVRNDDGCQG